MTNDTTQNINGSNQDINQSKDDLSFRLPRDVIPIRYNLYLNPNLENASFYGSEIIEVEINNEVDSIVLNALELEILTLL